MPVIFTVLCADNFASGSSNSVHRSRKAIAQFQFDHPCPASMHKYDTCPGYVVDHIVPLCAGGIDDPSNMQWQSKAESLMKDKEEWRLCHALRGKAPP